MSRLSPRLALASALLAVPVIGGGVASATGVFDQADPTLASTMLPATSVSVASPDLDEAGLAAADAFWGAGHTYDELVALSGEWHVSELEAKVRAGASILSGDTAELDATIAALDVAPVVVVDVEGFFDAGYTYDDAVALAAEWKLPTPYDAKVRGADLLRSGDAAAVATALSAAGA